MACTTNYLQLLIALIFAHQAVGHLKAYFRLSNESTYPRLVLGSLPKMHEYTFCAWVRPHRLDVEYPYIFSYATTRYHNELTVLLQRTTEDSILGYVQMGEPFANFNCPSAWWKVGTWQHVCATWLGADGSTKFYANGKPCSPVGNSAIFPRSHVTPGGVAILGQDQDAVGGKFEAHQAWYGDMTSVNLWNEALLGNQIAKLATCDGISKEGNVIAWSKTPMKAYDGVMIADTKFCDL